MPSCKYTTNCTASQYETRAPNATHDRRCASHEVCNADALCGSAHSRDLTADDTPHNGGGHVDHSPWDHDAHAEVNFTLAQQAKCTQYQTVASTWSSDRDCSAHDTCSS